VKNERGIKDNRSFLQGKGHDMHHAETLATSFLINYMWRMFAEDRLGGKKHLDKAGGLPIGEL